jgi:hypothetical protein
MARPRIEQVIDVPNLEGVSIEYAPQLLDERLIANLNSKLKEEKIQYVGQLKQIPLDVDSVLRLKFVCYDGIAEFDAFFFYKKKLVGSGRKKFMGWCIVDETETGINHGIQLKNNFMTNEKQKLTWGLDKDFKNVPTGTGWVARAERTKFDAGGLQRAAAIEIFEKHLKKQALLADYKYMGQLTWGPDRVVSREAISIQTAGGPVEIVVVIFQDTESVMSSTGKLLVPKDQIPLACAWYESD